MHACIGRRPRACGSPCAALGSRGRTRVWQHLRCASRTVKSAPIRLICDHGVSQASRRPLESRASARSSAAHALSCTLGSSMPMYCLASVSWAGTLRLGQVSRPSETNCPKGAKPRAPTSEHPPGHALKTTRCSISDTSRWVPLPSHLGRWRQRLLARCCCLAAARRSAGLASRFWRRQ